MNTPVDALYIGNQKSASTFLRHYLYAHPQVDLQRHGVFLHSPQADPSRGRDRVLQDYAALFGDRLQGTVRMDMYEGLGLGYLLHADAWETGYMMDTHARLDPGRIVFDPEGFVDRLATLFGPGLRVVLSIRNQVDWIGSNLRHYSSNFSAPLSLLDFLGCPEGKLILAGGFYDRMVGRLVERFGADNVLVLATEQLRQEEQLLLDELCDFLAVSRTPYPQSERRYNTGRGYAKSAGVRQGFLATLARRFCPAQTKPERGPLPVSESEKRLLGRFYAASNQNLFRLLGRDLSAYGYET